MKNQKLDNLINKLSKEYGNDLLNIIEFHPEEISEDVFSVLKEIVQENYKPKEINTIQDLAKLLDNNLYLDELNNPYDIDIENLCKKNKWIILFPYSDDNLEVRGYIYDEISAYDGVKAVIYKKGSFYPEDINDGIFKKATNNMICGINDEAIYETEIEDGRIGIDMQWEPNDKQYIWYITTKFKNVAYFDIHEEDEDDKIWARCCIIDCSKIL